MSEVVFRDGSKDALSNIRKLRDVALMESAIIVEGECIVRCPVDTGHLRGSISRKVCLSTGSVEGTDQEDGVKGAPEVGEAVVGTNVSYAPHVEYGTKFQRAQPFMRTGAVAAEPKVKQIFRNRLGQQVNVTRFEGETHVV